MDLRSLRYFVTVAQERHIGRAARRLHMTQPPLSRAIRELEDELGVTLFERTSKGVTLTNAGTVMYDESVALLEHADLLRTRVTAAAGATTLTIGTLADTAELVAGTLVTRFREQHPSVEVSIREADLGDPTAGLRAGLVDVALTRTPFEDNGISTRILRRIPVGVVLRGDDPLAGRESIGSDDLTDRRWVRLPDNADPLWAAYWTGGPPDGSSPIVRTIQECLQAVLWNATSALAPLDQPLPTGLVVVPFHDRPPSHLVVAQSEAAPSPLVRSFVQLAVDSFR
ncbi:LysR family transcriptional regulator [Nocardia jiangxiensis]|uniref:LysR family transcriptional regulator n=1 Tax=Nocardia jiangxiensis TaxID=282685 RepID=A0ABW6SAZ3_9NOCA|nr:LysR family transcriptional regulator [Nocardia jiangxiensis]